MAAKDGENCKQCKRWTKYRCIRCKVAICNLCSEPEIDESVDGWIGGKNVGYCFECETVRPVTELLIASRHSYEEVEEKIERQMKSTVKRKGNLLSLIKVIISKKLSQTRNVNTRCSYVCSLSHA